MKTVIVLLAALLSSAPAGADHREPESSRAIAPGTELSGPALVAQVTPEQWAALDGKRVIVTLPEQVAHLPNALRFSAVSFGVLPLEPARVRGVLSEVSSYQDWLRLSPSYKAVRPQGSSSFVADLGSSKSKSSRYSLTYQVTVEGDRVAWTVKDSRAPLQEGSVISYEAVPHPTVPGSTVLVHRHVIVLPKEGRMTRYLSKENDEGDSHFWKDATKHAKRVHWAIAAALEHPPGQERSQAYLDHFHREFGPGALPYWAQP